MLPRQHSSVPILNIAVLFGVIISSLVRDYFGAVIFFNGGFMTEQNNRVLARRGARGLTAAEVAEVGGGFGTPGIIHTDLITNFGKDFQEDQIQG